MVGEKLPISFCLSRIERLAKSLGASETRLEIFQEMQGQAVATSVANARAAWERDHSDLSDSVSLSHELADSNFESIQALKAENARLVKQNKRLNAAVCLERDKGGGRLAYERELRDRIEDLEASVRKSEKLVADAIDGKVEPPTASEIEARLWDTLEDEERTSELEEGVRQFSARLTQGERWHAMKALEAGRRTPVEVLQALGMACAVDRVESYEQLRAAGVKCTPAQIEAWTDTEVREAVEWAQNGCDPSTEPNFLSPSSEGD